jgi:hypothetical protein
MREVRWGFLFIIPLLVTVSAFPQTAEALPEADVYVNVLHSSVRFAFQAKRTRENGERTQLEFGPSFEFHLKPLLKLKSRTLHDLDQSKKRVLAFSFGYRRLTSGRTPDVNRVIFQVTSNLPFQGGLLISNRNRGELNFSSSELTWRYRNRTTIERAFGIHSYHLSPYVSAEFFYDSKYHKWSSTALYAGTILPLGKRFQIDPYYEHENNTGKSPNQQINAFGIILNFHF